MMVISSVSHVCFLHQPLPKETALQGSGDMFWTADVKVEQCSL